MNVLSLVAGSSSIEMSILERVSLEVIVVSCCFRSCVIEWLSMLFQAPSHRFNDLSKDCMFVYLASSICISVQVLPVHVSVFINVAAVVVLMCVMI